MPTPVVLELGSHSLKAHFQTEDKIFQEVRFPWSLGHEVYDCGRLSEKTLEQAAEALEELTKQGFLRKSLFAIATGALRDADDTEGLARELSRRMGVEVRVLTGREEASMLAKGFLGTRRKLPALLGDIGGGTLELVYLSAEYTILRDSLPLGAVRMYQLGSEEKKPWNKEVVERWIDSSFEEGSVLTHDEVNCTGGTVKAASRILKKSALTLEDLADLIGRVEREGAPETLDEPRRRVFLPGLLVLRGLLRHTRAKHLHYTKISVGQTFLRRLLKRYGASASGRNKDELLKNMRLTNVYPDTNHPQDSR